VDGGATKHGTIENRNLTRWCKNFINLIIYGVHVTTSGTRFHVKCKLQPLLQNVMVAVAARFCISARMLVEKEVMAYSILFRNTTYGY
jgi:hypothetical protein